MMKRMCILALALCLLYGAVIPASADAVRGRYLFCYVIGISADTIDVITADEYLLSFGKDDSVQIVSDRDLVVDDAVLLMYEGDLNLDAQAQSAKLSKVRVLNTLSGRVEDAAANSISVRVYDQNGEPSELYIFAVDDADVVVGEQGILVGDDVEVAFQEPLSELKPDAAQGFAYVHITVYGQIETDIE